MNTGQQKWVSDKFGKYASLIANGSQILALSSAGELLMFKANPERFEMIDRRPVGTNSWAHLAVSGDEVFVRNLNELLVLKWKGTN